MSNSNQSDDQDKCCIIKEISLAAEMINAGKLVAMPTETVYGLAANAHDAEACMSIFLAKGRPQNNPLIIHVTSLEQAEEYAVFSEEAKIFAKEFWPGPLTLVLPLKQHSSLAPAVTAGLDTVAIRIPAHDIALKLINEVGAALAAPSANISGSLSPTRFEHVYADFKNQDIGILIDQSASALECRVGLESTIIHINKAEISILRSGFIQKQALQQIINKHNIKLKFNKYEENNDKPIAPGMAYRHYSPKAKLVINATSLKQGEIGINFGKQVLDNPYDSKVFNLSESGNLVQAAANLYSMLHEADIFAAQNNLNIIKIVTIPNTSLGIAINDRISKGSLRE